MSLIVSVYVCLFYVVDFYHYLVRRFVFAPGFLAPTEENILGAEVVCELFVAVVFVITNWPRFRPLITSVYVSSESPVLTVIFWGLSAVLTVSVLEKLFPLKLACLEVEALPTVFHRLVDEALTVSRFESLTPELDSAFLLELVDILVLVEFERVESMVDLLSVCI